MEVEVGIYQHYKGGKYRVIGVAKHSETLEDLIIYEALYENKTSNIWARPIEMFVDEVEVGTKKIPRFKFLSQK